MAQMLSAMTMMDTVPTAPAIMPNQAICLDAPMSGSGITVVSRQAVLPDGPPSAIGDLTLSVSDLPMLSCHYIQKGLFFPAPDVPMASLVSLLVSSLSRALAIFPALAGRFVTLPDDRIVIRCNDAGVDFHHAVAPALSLNDFLLPNADVPTRLTKDLFPMDRTVSYEGHRRPLTSFQLLCSATAPSSSASSPTTPSWAALPSGTFITPGPPFAAARRPSCRTSAATSLASQRPSSALPAAWAPP
ncbi:hypothetical protein ZWY2020_030909 [Hordeum vulgare]|nr:hypothetical protein ZWY2020_030909 [Hordeum vulgare]